MLNRRIVMAGAAALGLVAVSLPAVAQDWKARYPELVFAVVPAENASGSWTAGLRSFAIWSGRSARR